MFHGGLNEEFSVTVHCSSHTHFGMPRAATNSKAAKKKYQLLTKTPLEFKDSSTEWSVSDVALVWCFNPIHPKCTNNDHNVEMAFEKSHWTWFF